MVGGTAGGRSVDSGYVYDKYYKMNEIKKIDIKNNYYCIVLPELTFNSMKTLYAATYIFYQR